MHWGESQMVLKKNAMKLDLHLVKIQLTTISTIFSKKKIGKKTKRIEQTNVSYQWV